MDPDALDSSHDVTPRWHVAVLREPAPLLLLLVVLVVSVAASAIVACNIHEVGHVLVALPLGWEVERMNFCLLGGGSVEYASIGVWAGNAQGYAGGIIAAAFLGLVYVIAFAVPRTPLRSPAAWVAGFGPILWIGPQVVIGLVEGTTSLGEDYTERMRESMELYVPMLLGTMACGVFVHLWLWRTVLQPAR